MKRLVLKYGEFLLNFIVIFAIAGFILLGFVSAKTTFNNTHNIMRAFFSFLIVSLVGIGGTIISCFVIYLLIDIRDLLKQLINKQN